MTFDLHHTAVVDRDLHGTEIQAVQRRDDRLGHVPRQQARVHGRRRSGIGRGGPGRGRRGCRGVRGRVRWGGGHGFSGSRHVGISDTSRDHESERPKGVPQPSPKHCSRQRGVRVNANMTRRFRGRCPRLGLVTDFQTDPSDRRRRQEGDGGVHDGTGLRSFTMGITVLRSGVVLGGHPRVSPRASGPRADTPHSPVSGRFEMRPVGAGKGGWKIGIGSVGYRASTSGAARLRDSGRFRWRGRRVRCRVGGEDRARRSCFGSRSRPNR